MPCLHERRYSRRWITQVYSPTLGGSFRMIGTFGTFRKDSARSCLGALLGTPGPSHTHSRLPWCLRWLRMATVQAPATLKAFLVRRRHVGCQRVSWWAWSGATSPHATEICWNGRMPRLTLTLASPGEHSREIGVRDTAQSKFRPTTGCREAGLGRCLGVACLAFHGGPSLDVAAAMEQGCPFRILGIAVGPCCA